MKNSGICILSMLGGVVLGSALAMFLTPKTGSEFRQMLRECFEKEADKIRCHCHDHNNE